MVNQFVHSRISVFVRKDSQVCLADLQQGTLGLGLLLLLVLIGGHTPQLRGVVAL